MNKCYTSLRCFSPDLLLQFRLVLCGVTSWRGNEIETSWNIAELKVSAFHRTLFEVLEISCSQKEQNHSQRTRRITNNPSISTENNYLLEHPPSLTLDSAKKIESVTPDYRTPECGIRYLLLYAPISCYNWCVENRSWKSCYLKFWVYSMLTLITMIIMVHNSPFCSQTVPCSF